jgi:hypothetical protein
MWRDQGLELVLQTVKCILSKDVFDFVWMREKGGFCREVEHNCRGKGDTSCCCLIQTKQSVSSPGKYEGFVAGGGGNEEEGRRNGPPGAIETAHHKKLVHICDDSALPLVDGSNATCKRPSMGCWLAWMQRLGAAPCMPNNNKHTAGLT